MAKKAVLSKEKENKTKPEIKVVSKKESTSFNDVEKLSDKQIIESYSSMQEELAFLFDKSYILDWKVFGDVYKGKYIGLKIEKGLFMFGETRNDVKYIKAETIKEAYLEYEKSSK